MTQVGKDNMAVTNGPFLSDTKFYRSFLYLMKIDFYMSAHVLFNLSNELWKR